MKPKNNRVMCPECFRAKMLFETQKQADNFIKWNGDDIDTHGGELRSYYCPACGGYHISSKPYKESYDHATEDLIKRYENDSRLGKVNKILKKAQSMGIVERMSKEIIDSSPKFSNPTRKFLRDYIDCWLKEQNVELKSSEIGPLRHLVYTNYSV